MKRRLRIVLLLVAGAIGVGIWAARPADQTGAPAVKTAPVS